MKHIIGHIKEKVRGGDKTVGIFGTGAKASEAKALLGELGISEFVSFDNDERKWNDENRVLNPALINKEYFILISTVWFEPIKKQLEGMGFREMEDYIWALDLEYYDALLRYQNEPYVPEILLDDLQKIEKELKKVAQVKRVDWFDETEFLKFEETLELQEAYNKAENKRYRRKMMEYYCVHKLLNFQTWKETDVYVDVGAAGSPFAKRLREMWGIEACSVDLNVGKYSELPYYFTEDATAMHFAEDKVKGISMQSAYEMFAGDADIRFVREAARVLQEGGKVVISPLYMHKQHLSMVSPNYYHTGMADDGSLECIRTDCRGNIPIARFYSVAALRERVLRPAAEHGLSVVIYALPQELVEKDQFVYLKFILCLEKIKA